MTIQRETTNRIIIIDDNPAIHEDFKKILVSDRSQVDEGLLKAEEAFFGDVIFGNDDDDLNIELVSALQGAEGYQKVLESINENRPFSLAFVDMRMPPGWDGLTTIEKIWEADPNLQVVICSAYSDNTWSGIARRLGRSDKLLILKKPFDNAEVMQLATALIEKRRLSDVASQHSSKLENAVAENQIKLLEFESELERFLFASQTPLVKLDSDGIVSRWNDAASNLFGIEKENAKESCFADLPIAWDEVEVIQTICDHQRFWAEASSRSSADRSIEIKTKFTSVDGNEKCVQFTLPTKLNGEKITGTIFSVSEIENSQAAISLTQNEKIAN